ncbi:MAG TPA: YceI family protein [Dehalococcoidia bacterium]|nr:YceI family protein [Dehalococcoidia bacterium]
MRVRYLVAGLAAAAVVMVAVGAGGWWFLVREDAELATEPRAIPEEVSASDQAADDSATPPMGDVSTPEETISFTIIPEFSEAAYFVDEELASLGLPSTAKGSTKSVEGALHLTTDGELAPDRESRFTVDLTTLMSSESRRDDRVQEALNTVTYPTATFIASELTGYDASLPEGSEQNLQLTGILDLHGVQKEITWTIVAIYEGDAMSGPATFEGLFADFGITPPNIAGFVTVEDDFTLQVQIVAEQVQAAG